ncbi:MAG: HAD-IIIA family hydrolase [Rhodospirillales bacterium]|nr:HAD-IIIA family hydrolase [Rhodospirillales bacterium]
MPRLVLLDRDGVLNVDRPDSVRHPDALELIPGAAAAVARLNKAGVIAALVSNQAVVGRGEVAPSMLDHIHAKMRTLLQQAGAHLDAEFVCTDAHDSPRRKPAPGMLLEAMARFGAAPAETMMIGDALRDLEAAAAAGCPRVLVLTGKGAETASDLPDRVRPVAIRADLAAAVDALLAGDAA